MEIEQNHLLVKMPQQNILKAELRYANQYLAAHNLYQSAKFAGELLLGISKDDHNQMASQIKSSNIDMTYKFDKVYIENYNSTYDSLLVARNLFDLREYKKCAYVLQDFVGNSDNQSAIFFYYYSTFLSGEVRKEEEMQELENNTKCSVNPEVETIERNMKALYDQNKLNEINKYVYALTLKEKGQLNEAKYILIQILNKFPCFWSAWVELCKIVRNDDIRQLISQFKEHWMLNFFVASFKLEKQDNLFCIEIYYELLCFFQNSNFILNQLAHSYYDIQEYDTSQDLFEKLVTLDPYRFENMDTFSNILYIKENQGDLANLALRCFYNNKYSPESCCVIGNYFSLMGEHLKAVIYFRRALKLDRSCLPAWTLMGHEYIEMKNIPGAIEAYRSAVEIDSKDFRAWYGLGQTYELQNMFHYSLYYYTRAVMSRPNDSRMWNAMASCYEKMERKIEAQKCYERAESNQDKDGIAIHQLGKLYDLLGFKQKSAQCFEQNLKRKDEQNCFDKETAECLIYLAQYYKEKQEINLALKYAMRLKQFQGSERDESNQLIHEIQNLNR